MKKSLLFISIEYPPKSGPGAARNFFFCKDIADNGWDVNVLTIKKNATSTLDKSFDKFHSKARVHRTAVRDTTKTFSLFGKYPKFIEIPDRWSLWLLTAIPKGLSLIKKQQPSLLYVSYPSYSNLLVAVCLHKLTRVKLIVELRDPFRYRYDGKNMPSHWLYKWIEKISIQNASALITTTQECLSLYQHWFPTLAKQPTGCFKNGFAADIHRQAKSDSLMPLNQKFTLLHSGSLYSIGRNPLPLLQAVQQLKEKHIINSENFELVFRGCQPWHDLTKHIEEMDIVDIIIFKKSVDYHESIAEMYQCSAIIIIQEELFNAQIPSKLYDGLKTQKPIIAITPPESALSNELKKNHQQAGTQCSQDIAIQIQQLLTAGEVVIDSNIVDSQRSVINTKLTIFLNKQLDEY